MYNVDLREYFKAKGVRHIVVAKMVNYSESGFYRLLASHEFSDDIKNQLKQSINEFLTGETPDVTYFYDYINTVSHENQVAYFIARREALTQEDNVDSYINRILHDVNYYENRNRTLYDTLFDDTEVIYARASRKLQYL